MKISDYNLDWEEYFKLDDKSPSGLVRFKKWSEKITEVYTFGHQHFRKNGQAHAWVISFKGRDYYVHRIIWAMVYGSIDSGLVVDHLDGNPFNNSIENLSLKTHKDNSRNQCKRTRNKTGETGVRLVVVRCKYRYYEASWYSIEGKFTWKHFSVLKLGEELAKSLAVTHRAEQIQKLIVEGAGYTERHGT